MANDSVGRTFLVAFLVCFVCSLLVSGTAAGLRAKQQRDAKLLQYRNILQVTGIQLADVDLAGLWQERVEARLVELESGVYSDAFAPESYNQRRAANNPDLNRQIPETLDIADLNTRARFAPAYLIRDGDKFSQLVLPVHGKGLWSTLYGYIALAPDLKTVQGFSIYEHGETPGLGGEVDNPNWQAKWSGKQIADEQGRLQIEVIKGSVDPGNAKARYQVDGLSGATMTSRGVTNLLLYWLGEDGFGPLLNRLRQEGLHG